MGWAWSNDANETGITKWMNAIIEWANAMIEWG